MSGERYPCYRILDHLAVRKSVTDHSFVQSPETQMEKGIRIGVDPGGTKIEALALSQEGKDLRRVQIATLVHMRSRSRASRAS